MEKLHTTTNAWCRGYRSAFGVAQFRKVKFVVAGQRQDRAIQKLPLSEDSADYPGKSEQRQRAGQVCPARPCMSGPSASPPAERTILFPNYMTMAKLSSSRCRTSIEQPDSSTRAAASMAAPEETP
jgi:hypothetical protein